MTRSRRCATSASESPWYSLVVELQRRLDAVLERRQLLVPEEPLHKRKQTRAHNGNDAEFGEMEKMITAASTHTGQELLSTRHQLRMATVVVHGRLVESWGNRLVTASAVLARMRAWSTKCVSRCGVWPEHEGRVTTCSPSECQIVLFPWR